MSRTEEIVHGKDEVFLRMLVNFADGLLSLGGEAYLLQLRQEERDDFGLRACPFDFAGEGGFGVP